MVCEKCGRAIKDYYKECPYCGVGLETKNKVDKGVNDFKIEENTSSFNTAKNNNLDIKNFIEDLEYLKIKPGKDSNLEVPKVDIISDEELEDVLEDMLEYKKKQNEIKLLQNQKNKEKINKSKEQSNKSDIVVKEDIFKLLDEKNSKNNIDDSNKPNSNLRLNTKLFEDSTDNFVEKSSEFTQDDNSENNENNMNLNEPKVIHIPFEMEQKKNNKVISTISLLFISIFSFVFFIGMFIMYRNSFSPKIRMLNALEETYNEFDKAIEKLTNHYDILKGMNTVEISSNANIYETIDNQTTNTIVTTKYIESKEEKKQYFEYNNNNDKFVSFIQNNELYLKQNDDDTLYVVDSKYINLLELLNREDNTYLKKTITQIIKDELNGNDFTQKKVKEKYNNIEYDLNRISLELSEDKFNNILIKIIDSIKTDANAINIIEKNSKYTVKEIKNYFNDLSNNLKEKANSDMIFKYDIYYDSHNNIIKHSLKYKDKININCWNIGKTKDITLKLNKNDIYNISINNNYDILNVSINHDNKEINLQYSKQDDKYVINYQINKNISENTQKRKIVNIVSKLKKENNVYTNKFTINVDSNLEKNMKQSIIVTTTIKEVDEIPSLEINNTSKYLPEEIKNKYSDYFSYFTK